MKFVICISLIFALAACGVETASTAVTAAAVKKQEIEQGQRTMQQFQQNLDQANQQAAERAESAVEQKR